MPEQDMLRHERMPAHGGLPRWRDAVLLKIVRSVMPDVLEGRLTLVMPSGVSATFGSPGGVDAVLTLHDLSVVRKAMRRGALATVLATSAAASSPRFAICRRQTQKPMAARTVMRPRRMCMSAR